MDEMSHDEYLQTQTQVCLIAGIVRELPLRGFIDAMAGAEALGMIRDPTLYRAANRNLSALRGLAEALLAFQAKVIEAGIGDDDEPAAGGP